ncbi:MAG: pyridoxal-dependent decarboxylase, exosortase A system-associated, partial [Gammaproteobacteria bacterium]|nr:pyridoxal-dependent decarboxylase, exosortase A system-associated [Gammaproteobacteria bacterium]
GSQNLNVDHIMSAHENIFKLADQISQQNGIAFKHLNIGGGLGIPYFPGEKEIDDEGIRQIGDALDMLIERYHQSFADTEIIMELGRYLVGNAGLYVCEVTDIKESRGKTFVIVNGGLHHHLAASGNFGQVIRKNYPVAVANKINQPVDKAVQIVGPLCTPLDILANQYELPKIEMGDLIAIYQSGAYGYTASPRDFLSHLQPVEILV